MDPNPYSSVESKPLSEDRGPAQSESVMWFSGTGFVILFIAQAIGLVTNRIGGSVFQVSVAMAVLAAAYSFLATLLYLIVTLLLPRGATIATVWAVYLWRWRIRRSCLWWRCCRILHCDGA